MQLCSSAALQLSCRFAASPQLPLRLRLSRNSNTAPPHPANTASLASPARVPSVSILRPYPTVQFQVLFAETSFAPTPSSFLSYVRFQVPRRGSVNLARRESLPCLALPASSLPAPTTRIQQQPGPSLQGTCKAPSSAANLCYFAASDLKQGENRHALCALQQLVDVISSMLASRLLGSVRLPFIPVHWLLIRWFLPRSFRP